MKIKGVQQDFFLLINESFTYPPNVNVIISYVREIRFLNSYLPTFLPDVMKYPVFFWDSFPKHIYVCQSHKQSSCRQTCNKLCLFLHVCASSFLSFLTLYIFLIFVAGLSNVFIGITKSISIRRIVQSFNAENTNVIFYYFLGLL